MLEICLRFAWHMPDMFLIFTWHLREICLRFACNMPNIYDMPNIGLKLQDAWHFTDICLIFLRFAWSLLEMCLRFAWNLHKIWLRFTWDIPEICLRLSRDLPILIIDSASADASGDESAAKYSERSAILCFFVIWSRTPSAGPSRVFCQKK